MFIRIISLVILILLPFSAVSADLKVVMHQLGEKMLIVLPSLYKDDVEVEDLQTDLKELTDLLKQAEPHLVETDSGTRANLNLLMDQLNQAQQLSQRSNINMLKSELSDTFALCASCHNQDRTFIRNYGISKFKHMDEFLAAEYGYITRDYESALSSYVNALKTANLDKSRTQASLDRVLVITLEVFNDPGLARDTLAVLRKESGQQGFMTEDLDEWIEVVDRIKEEPDSLHSPLSSHTVGGMDNYLRNEWPVVQSTLNMNQQLVYWIAIRGKLNQLLRANPGSAHTPILLYWLAVSDRALHYRFYDSLSRRYLVRCMRDYTRYEIAKECFKEYEMLMIVSFSGSGGIFLPVEAEREIGELRRLVYGVKPDKRK